MQDTINYTNIAEQCRLIINSDTARICKPLNKMFLIIGYYKHTKDDKKSNFTKNDKKFDFKYIEERVIASGYTTEELIESTREYVRLSGITMKEYLEELIN